MSLLVQSLEVAQTPLGLSAPVLAVPTTGVSGQVGLAWSAVTGAATYTVFRNGTPIATGAALTIIKTYQYPESENTSS